MQFFLDRFIFFSFCGPRCYISYWFLYGWNCLGDLWGFFDGVFYIAGEDWLNWGIVGELPIIILFFSDDLVIGHKFDLEGRYVPKVFVTRGPLAYV